MVRNQEIFNLPLSRAEVFSVLRALAKSNDTAEREAQECTRQNEKEDARSDLYTNTWIANRLVRLLPENETPKQGGTER